jgi:hypothetical protein
MGNRKKGKILLTCGLTALIVILFCPPWNLRAATAWPMGGKRYTERFVGWHFLTCSSVTLEMLLCDNGLRPVQMEVAGFGFAGQGSVGWPLRDVPSLESGRPLTA